MISKKYLSKLALPVFLFMVAVGMVSCSEDEPIIGSDLLKKDRIDVDSDSGLSFKAYTLSDESFLPKEANTLLAGGVNSEKFGASKAGFVSQLRLMQGSPLDTLQVDSAFVVLYFKGMIGDSLANQKIRVYEINNPLDLQTNYPEDFRPSLKTEIASMDFNKTSLVDVMRGDKVNLDTTKTFKFETLVDGKVVVKDTSKLPLLKFDTIRVEELQLRIPLKQDVVEYFKNADKTHFSSSEAFLNFFKGIYVETESPEGKGAIYEFSVLSQKAARSGIRFHLSYRNEEKKTETKYYEDKDGDGIYKEATFVSYPTYEYGFRVQDFSIRLNRFEHDQAGADIEQFFDKTDQEGDVVYAQGMLGSKIKIQAEGLNDYLKEKGKIAINKASLRLSVVDTLDVPLRLEIFALDDEGNEIALPDSEISPLLVNGFYSSKEKEYVFNIQNYLQEIVDNEDKLDNGLIIRTAGSSSNPRSVVVENPKVGDPKEEKRIKLTLTYTKL
ncbi:MAG: DUF4270 family protein [Marinifilaceae bacterium]